MTKLICTKCSSKIQVGDFFEKEWYCIWCINKVKKPKPYEPPPPYVVPTDFVPSEGKGYKYKRARVETKIEEIPCDNQL